MCAQVCFGSMSADRVQVKHHARDRARHYLFVRLTQMDGCGAVLCRMHYLIRVNFSNNPLLARVAHRGGGGVESLITLLLNRRSFFSTTQFTDAAFAVVETKVPPL